MSEALLHGLSQVEVWLLNATCNAYISFEQPEAQSDPRRLPVPPGERMERLKFFLYSCANWGYGYFNAYDVGSRYDLDFWVHLGDYVGTSIAGITDIQVYSVFKCDVL